MNKKYILIALILASSSLFANSFSVGGLAKKQNGLYKGVEDVNYLPYVNIKINNFYINGTELGYKFLDNSDFSLTAFSNLQDGYAIKAKNMDYGYKTINQRNKQITAGLKANFPFHIKNEKFNLSTSGEFGKKGIKSTLNLSKFFRPLENLIFIPNVNLKYFDKDYTRYYFGVKKSELGGAIKNEYNPSASYSIGLGLYTEYYFSKSFSVFTYLSAEKFSKQVKKSPITKADILTNIGLGLKYSF